MLFKSPSVRSSARIRLSFFSLSFASTGQTDALHVHVPTAENAPPPMRVSESLCVGHLIQKC